MFCNLGLAAVVLNAGGVERFNSDQNPDTVETLRATIYMAVVLYSVAVLSFIRFVGACYFLIRRLFVGV